MAYVTAITLLAQASIKGIPSMQTMQRRLEQLLLIKMQISDNSVDNHVYPNHQYINQLCEGCSNKIESTTAATNPNNTGTTQISFTQSSPNTKHAK